MTIYPRFTLTALDTPEDIMPICEAKVVQSWTDELSATNGVGVFKIRKACMDDNTVSVDLPYCLSCG